EANADGLFTVLEELAGGVVDRRDVVGVEGVAHPEAVREPAEAEESRVLVRDGQQEPPADDMDQRDRAVEQAKADALAAVEALGQGGGKQGHTVSPAYSAARRR